ncbi:TonB-dependent hemoglobin/transferrin/lactoferrin family receptor [Shinella zoogloeoides]|uniref:TonB-dependent hemoglobin/transferrin/lactoferrin family receptor n=1 Tax=Shinella zoogloeoides TaxID=352475 RepID=A0A6N8TDW3_SHIZO|nr:TonB-dependent hemoglobin/transferrin/lactoferrin family receptor [Shinella zoogloeoides]MXO01457.1 TonB-dependent hemoglobin/transferrin/lactoferrin family receptor [Shinella zoogloeoides]UEX80300.1 TonB-dependent hemoglobin/transferrin/lactoferrin family receptor [Shinella zoogloeoides]
MQARRYRTALLACTALAVLSLSTDALAQDAANAAGASTGQSTNLQAVVVKGRRVLPVGSVADTPLATQTTATEISRRQISSITDLGNTTEPGVGTGFDGSGVNIRGLDADRVLTSIDGVPLPYLTNGARQPGPSTTLGSSTRGDGGVDTYDFSSISTVDVMRGADSSRAGSGALGGALVLRTLEADDLIADGKDFGGLVKSTYDSADRSIGAWVALAKRFQDTSVLFQGGYVRGHERRNMGTVDTIGATRTESNPADFDQQNFMFKVRHDVGGGHTIGLTAERFHKDTTTDLKTDEGGITPRNYSDLDGDKERERNRVSVDYRYDAPDLSGPIDRADATLYWQQVVSDNSVYGTRTGGLAGPWYRGNEMEENGFGIVGSLGNQFDWGSTVHDVTVGGNLSYSKYSQYSAGRDVCDTMVPPSMSCSFHHTNQADMPDVDAYRVGLFIDDKISFADTGFSLTPGLRFDWYDYSPKETAAYQANSGYKGLPAGQSDFQFSPKLRAAYEVSPEVELFAQWSMAFKAPNPSELYMNYATPPMYRVIGNPDLKPETANGFEVGANLGDSEFGGRITGFYNRYKDFINDEIDYSDPAFPWGTTRYVNLDSVRIFGFEGRVHKSLANGFNVHASFAYANAEDRETGKKLASVAPFKGIIGGGYSTETWGVDTSLIAVAAVSEKSDATFQPRGYGIVNLTGWWEPEQFEGLRVTAGVYNLFDKEYYDAVKWRDIDLTTSTAQPKAYYSEPGRTFKVSISRKF